SRVVRAAAQRAGQLLELLPEVVVGGDDELVLDGLSDQLLARLELAMLAPGKPHCPVCLVDALLDGSLTCAASCYPKTYKVQAGLPFVYQVIEARRIAHYLQRSSNG